MDTIRDILILQSGSLAPDQNFWPARSFSMPQIIGFLSIIAGLAFLLLLPLSAHAAGTSLPGEDASGKLEAAGTLLRILDTGLFKWGARIFAGICIMSAAWALKEQRFGIAIICVVGAILFGTAPTWVKNIFEIGGNQGLFSQIEPASTIEDIAACDSLKEEKSNA